MPHKPVRHKINKHGLPICGKKALNLKFEPNWNNVTCKMCLRVHPDEDVRKSVAINKGGHNNSEQRENPKKVKECKKALGKARELLDALNELRTSHRYKKHIKGY